MSSLRPHPPLRAPSRLCAASAPRRPCRARPASRRAPGGGGGLRRRRSRGSARRDGAGRGARPLSLAAADPARSGPRPPSCGRRCWGAWRGSAPRWSQSVRARRSSPSTACAGSTAARRPASWRRRARRRSRRCRSPRRPTASPPSSPRVADRACRASAGGPRRSSRTRAAQVPRPAPGRDAAEYGSALRARGEPS